MDKRYKVQVKDLHKSYGSNEVLQGIDLNVAPSEVVCMIGPSGSGKSTFLRCLNRLEVPNGGHVYVDGYDIADPKVNINKVRENIGMVFQHFNLFPNMSVLDNITLAPVQLGKATKEAAEEEALRYLDLVGLREKANVNPQTLSGGQKQRVAIAGILALEPKIIILDEATSMLDPAGRQLVLRLLQQLRTQQQYTIISITHDPAEMAIADRVVVLDQGKIIRQGPVATVLQDVELLRHIGVGVPAGQALRQALAARGVAVPQRYFTEEEMVEWLCQKL